MKNYILSSCILRINLGNKKVYLINLNDLNRYTFYFLLLSSYILLLNEFMLVLRFSSLPSILINNT